jgi:hypothetical protein
MQSVLRLALICGLWLSRLVRMIQKEGWWGDKHTEE